MAVRDKTDATELEGFLDHRRDQHRHNQGIGKQKLQKCRGDA
jgi:hypothetical protein